MLGQEGLRGENEKVKHIHPQEMRAIHVLDQKKEKEKHEKTISKACNMKNLHLKGKFHGFF